MRHFRTLVILSILLCPGSALALVNVNAATKQEFADSGIGIGETTADKIIAYRLTNGAISDIATVCGLRGVGVTTATCKTIEAGIYFGPLATTSSSDETDDDEEKSSDTKSKSDRKVYIPVSSLKLTAPEISYVNQAVEFSVEPGDGRNNRLVRYHWNFGDGHSADVATPTHIYKYPGTYVVVVESSYLKEEKMTRHEIEVLPVQIKITGEVGNRVTLTNEGGEEIDLDGMKVDGNGDFVFPKHSILMPGKSVTVELPNGTYSTNLVLRDQTGQIIGNRESAVEIKPPPRPAVVATKDAVAPTTEEASAFFGPVARAAGTTTNAAAAVHSDFAADNWPYLGLVLLIGLGLYSLLGRNAV